MVAVLGTLLSVHILIKAFGANLSTIESSSFEARKARARPDLLNGHVTGRLCGYHHEGRDWNIGVNIERNTSHES